MTISHISTVFNNAASDFSDTPTVASVAAVAGDYILSAIVFRDIGSAPSSVLWGAESLVKIGSTYDTTQSAVVLYGKIATSSATSSVVCTLPTSQKHNISVSVLRDSSIGTITASTPQAQYYNSGTYSSPSLTTTSVPTGAILIDLLVALGWDTSFNDVTASTWSVTNTDRGSITCTTDKHINILAIQSAAGAGSNITSGWSVSANQPMYAHLALYLSASASTTIDTIDNPITVGTAFNLTTTGLGTLTTASTIGGVPVTAASAPSGDGTLTYSFTNAALGPLMGTVSVVASDGTNTATATGKTLQTMSGYTSIVLASLDRSSTSLGSDPAINNGDEVHAPNLGGGTLAATGLFTSVPFGTYSGFWKRDATDGKMYTFTVILSSTGTTVTGLTGVGLTVSKITVSTLTAKPM